MSSSLHPSTSAVAKLADGIHVSPNRPEKECKVSASVFNVVDRLSSASTFSGNVPYSGLVCTPADDGDIGELVKVMDEHNLFSLIFFYQSQLVQIGERLGHVHPLKFLSAIIGNPVHAQHLRSFVDSMKGALFIRGVKKSLNTECLQDNFPSYLTEFARENGIDPALLTEFSSKNRWEDMIRFLLDHKS